MNRPHILGIPADPITFQEMFEHIEQWIATQDRLHQICTINPEFIIMAQDNPAFYQVLQRADLCVLDGWGAVWALRIRGITVPERVTGSDGIPMLMQLAAEKEWRIFMLGAAEGIAEQAATISQQQNPHLQIVGTYAGSPNPNEADEIIQRVNAAQADILLVAYGAPKQDIWIDRYREQLQVSVAIGVGGVFDFIAGVLPRAPIWMRNAGLEWLYRLYLQPSRWRRMMRLPVFIVKALLYQDRPSKRIESE